MFATIKSTLSLSIIAAAALAVALPAAPSAAASVALRPAAAYHFANVASSSPRFFLTLDDQADPTFNQLLGINDYGLIAGYFGIGSVGHPNMGYTLSPPYAQSSYHNENYPGSVQTQVTALNNKHDTAGFWVDAKGTNFGFVEWNGVFTTYRDPNIGKGTVTQILGLNDAGTAVGFYTDGQGHNHGFALNQATGQFTKIAPAGTTNVTASAINANGDVTGFATGSNGVVVGFLAKNGGFSAFSVPNAMSTTPFGINANDEIVGSYMDMAGATHGFTLTNPLTMAKFTSIDDPNGIGTTVVNGVNSYGTLVGFYTDLAGNVNGFIAKK